MSVIESVKKILVRNNNLRKYKDDKSINSICIRVLNEFVTYGFYSLDENGNVMGVKLSKLGTLSNFELLHIIESIICLNDKQLMDNFLVKSIQSIDYIGKCWFYPKELSVMIFEETGDRHNYKKIKKILNSLVAENICLKITNKRRQSMYRILFTS